MTINTVGIPVEALVGVLALARDAACEEFAPVGSARYWCYEHMREELQARARTDTAEIAALTLKLINHPVTEVRFIGCNFLLPLIEAYDERELDAKPWLDCFEKMITTESMDTEYYYVSVWNWGANTANDDEMSATRRHNRQQIADLWDRYYED